MYIYVYIFIYICAILKEIAASRFGAFVTVPLSVAQEASRARQIVADDGVNSWKFHIGANYIGQYSTGMQSSSQSDGIWLAAATVAFGLGESYLSNRWRSESFNDDKGALRRTPQFMELSRVEGVVGEGGTDLELIWNPNKEALSWFIKSNGLIGFTPVKINCWNIIPWKFGSDHFPF